MLRMVFVPFIVIELVEGRYFWALMLFVIAGFSDGLDGLLARKLHQQTLLGQYLDPIADKLLLSTMFLVLSILHKIPWKFTVLVFSRDTSILAASAVLFAIAGLRNFQPSIFGKANTFSQIAAVFFRDAVLSEAAALGVDYTHGFLARHLCVHHYLGSALCFSRATPAAYARSCTASTFFRRYPRQLTVFLASP